MRNVPRLRVRKLAKYKFIGWNEESPQLSKCWEYVST